MKTLNVFDQQRADEVLRLEIAYSNLYRAYISGNSEEMIAKYVAAGNVNLPHFTDSIYLNTKQTMLSNGIIPDVLPTSIYEIKDDTLLRMNIQGCLKTLHDELSRRNIYSTQYTYAQSVLYRSTHTFQQEEVLYQNQQGQQFRVSDLLDVLKYAVGIAEAIEPSSKEYAKASAVISVVKGIDAILNNNPKDKPVNKMLHLLTSFLSSVVKSTIKDDEAKRGVTTIALVVELAIDFFCKE